MTVNDVDLVLQPDADQLGFPIEPSAADRRLTLQHFNNRDHVVDRNAPHNLDARQSDSDEWPPPLIFDVTYGCAALKMWGEHMFVNFAEEHVRNIYYNREDNGGDGGGGSRNGGNRGDGKPDDGQSEKHSQQVHGHDAWTERRMKACQRANNTGDSDLDFFDIILGLWMFNARLKDQHQARAMGEDKTREKVQTWLESPE
jgi:hypothetical protein